MAVRAYTEIDTKWQSGGAARVYEWAGLLQNDTGVPLRIPQHSDITVSVLSGTLGAGGTITWEGTLDDATTPSQYGGVSKPDGTALTLNALGNIKQMLEHPLQIRPNVTAGDGTTNLVVRAIVVKQWRD